MGGTDKGAAARPMKRKRKPSAAAPPRKSVGGAAGRKSAPVTGEISVHMSHFCLGYLREIHRLFEGDLGLVIVLGEIAHHNLSGHFVPSWTENAAAREIPNDAATIARLPSCNAYSLAASTGLPRETIRRKIARLEALGWVTRAELGGLRITPRVAEHFAPDFNVRLLENLNGWREPNPKNAKAGPHLLDRATTQLIQIGVLPAEEALYYVSFRDADGNLLDGRQPHRLVFAKGELPPIRPGGFWSVTMYDERSFLVENPIQRYVLRTDTEGLMYGSDGALTLHLQPEAPANAPGGNWLPTPRGGFILALRCYLPTAAATSGKWFSPAIQRAK